MSCTTMHTMANFYPQPHLQPSTTRSTAPPRQIASSLPLFIRRTHPTAIAQLCPRVGTVGERSRRYAVAVTRRRRAKHGNVIRRPTSESTWTARPVHESVRVPRAGSGLHSTRTLLLPPPFFLSLPHSRIRSQRVVCGSRLAWHLALSQTRQRGPRGALGLVVLLAADGRA